MMDEVPLHKDSKLFRPYSGIKSTGIRSFFDSVFVKKEEGLYNENIIYEWGEVMKPQSITERPGTGKMELIRKWMGK